MLGGDRLDGDAMLVGEGGMEGLAVDAGAAGGTEALGDATGLKHRPGP